MICCFMVIDYVPKKQANGTRFTCATKRSERSGRLETHVGRSSQGQNPASPILEQLFHIQSNVFGDLP